MRSVVTTCAVTGFRGEYKVAWQMSNRRDIDIHVVEWNDRVYARGEYSLLDGEEQLSFVRIREMIKNMRASALSRLGGNEFETVPMSVRLRCKVKINFVCEIGRYILMSIGTSDENWPEMLFIKARL